MRFGIMQLKRDKLEDFGFMGYDMAERVNGVGSVVKDNYDEIYAFDMDSSRDVELDDIFYIFNMSRPDDFYGHSLSVSDVVRCDDKYYYCDSFGWKELEWK